MSSRARSLIRRHMLNPVLLHLRSKFSVPIIGMLDEILFLISHTVSRVFLGGKAHVDYRRTLNTLFTRKALR
jgi:hypothetical protein